jgi:uncharacterized protein YgiB involved in biofilm formation
MNKLVIVSIDTENDVCVFNKVDDRDPNNIKIEQCTRTVAVAKQMFEEAKAKAEAQKAAMISVIDTFVSEVNTELTQFPA